MTISTSRRPVGLGTYELFYINNNNDEVAYGQFWKVSKNEFVFSISTYVGNTWVIKEGRWPDDLLCIKGFLVANDPSGSSPRAEDIPCDSISDGPTSPAATPTTTVVPTTTTVNPLCIALPPSGFGQCPVAENIAAHALLIVETKLSGSPDGGSAFDVRTSPNASSAAVSDVLLGLTKASAFWSSEYPTDTPTIVLISGSSDVDWLIGELVELGLSTLVVEAYREMIEGRDQPEDVEGGGSIAAAFTTEEGTFVMYVTGTSRSFKSVPDWVDMTWFESPPHEFTHLVQDLLSSLGITTANLPCWWIEGQASYFGHTLAFLTRSYGPLYDSYDSWRGVWIEGRTSDAVSDRSVPDWVAWLESAEDPGSNCIFSEGVDISEGADADGDGYGAGGMATEYLLGQYGLPKMVEMMGAFDPIYETGECVEAFAITESNPLSNGFGFFAYEASADEEGMTAAVEIIPCDSTDDLVSVGTPIQISATVTIEASSSTSSTYDSYELFYIDGEGEELPWLTFYTGSVVNGQATHVGHAWKIRRRVVTNPWQSVMEQTYGKTLAELYDEIAVHLNAVFSSP